MKRNQQTFTFEYELKADDANKGYLFIEGHCWECPAGDIDGYDTSPYGFDITLVNYTRLGGNLVNVTGFYDYLVSRNRIENIEIEVLEHVALIYKK